MNLKIKGILMVLAILLTLTFATGCQQEATPYEKNNDTGYTVSVKFDANGGTFATNTTVIVDSYNISEMTKGSDGQVQIALLTPDDEQRGATNAFKAANADHFLAGWYKERTDNGDGTYTYSGKWDFAADTLAVDPNGTYNSEEPVLTLYAAWVPMFQIEMYDLESGELLSTMEYDPIKDGELQVPAWDEKTGAIDMFKFPVREGYTFAGAYLDEAGTQQVTAETLAHTGYVDYETGTAKEPVMKLYTQWDLGEWYHIYTPEQFADNASLTGSYELHADLDFTDKIWPTVFMHGNYTGTIRGNGHTISNVVLEQTNNSKTNAGLFGNLTATAKLQELTLDNIQFVIKGGTRVAGTGYGLLAGTVSEGAVCENLSITNSVISVDAGAYFGTDDYAIGLVCGMGTPPVDYAGITCSTNSETFAVYANGNEVLLAEPGEVPETTESADAADATEETTEATEETTEATQNTETIA